uniref:Uncharacterized protein n=1 Tax=Peronospora matthiolae TaxID=2874970 RepID=A0AAV1UXM6_9STRA
MLELWERNSGARKKGVVMGFSMKKNFRAQLFGNDEADDGFAHCGNSSLHVELGTGKSVVYKNFAPEIALHGSSLDLVASGRSRSINACYAKHHSLGSPTLTRKRT